MSTGVLQALMQLFAIITKSGGDDGLHNNGRDVIAIFLRQQLNRDLVKKFLASYDEFVAVQGGAARDSFLSGVPKPVHAAARVHTQKQKESRFALKPAR